jgi:BirA family biotin operon repressor/biotin-[acetyl-CoA-carboxylase] ligase
VSPAGTGLYVSLLLRPEFPAAETGSAVQLVAGIATAETLNEFLPNKPVLRWPNDCFVLDSKIAGVLVEAETTGRGFDFLVCGIGVNVNQEVADFPAALRGRATSVKLQLGHRVSRLDVLATLLDTFDSWEAAWREYGMDPIRERWLELSPESVAGSVSVQTETGLIEGVANGLTDAGHLIVGTDDGTHEISVGEVIRLRPL